MQRSFLRLTVTPSLLKLYDAEVFTNLEALDLLRSLARHPKVGFLEEPADGETRCHQLASAPSAPPKVWIDAYLAAFAIGHKLERVTPDGDFERFVKKGLKASVFGIPCADRNHPVSSRWTRELCGVGSNRMSGITFEALMPLMEARCGAFGYHGQCGGLAADDGD